MWADADKITPRKCVFKRFSKTTQFLISDSINKAAEKLSSQWTRLIENPVITRLLKLCGFVSWVVVGGNTFVAIYTHNNLIHTSCRATVYLHHWYWKRLHFKSGRNRYCQGFFLSLQLTVMSVCLYSLDTDSFLWQNLHTYKGTRQLMNSGVIDILARESIKCHQFLSLSGRSSIYLVLAQWGLISIYPWRNVATLRLISSRCSCFYKETHPLIR